ncbi:MAG: hypothetical protein ABSA69_08435 [Verrucomicrobiota bacterium]|jgi:hypothetical protein
MVRIWVSVLLGMGTQVLSADVPDNPYQGIIDRNVFDLKPPVDPATLVPPAAPPPKITLTGFTTILGNKRVLFKVQLPPTPPAPAKEESYILTEGQRDGDIEVLEIDNTAGIAKFNNHGTIQTLDLAEDGMKPSNTPTPQQQGLRPRLPNRMSTGQNPEPAPQGGDMKRIPTRTLRMSPLPGGAGSRAIPGYPGPQPPNPPPQAGP